MSSDHDQPAAKRIRLDDAPAAPEPTAPSTPTSSSSSNLISSFFRQDAPGLFGVLAASLGKRAATEEEVGITRFIAPEVEPFSAIIKHRLSSLLPSPRSTAPRLTCQTRTASPTFSCTRSASTARSCASRPSTARARSATSSTRTRPSPTAPHLLLLSMARQRLLHQARSSRARRTLRRRRVSLPRSSTRCVSRSPSLLHPLARELTLALPQPVALWNETSAAAAAPLFEASPTKLDEFKAFIEAGPGSAKDKRTFVSDVRSPFSSSLDQTA